MTNTHDLIGAGWRFPVAWDGRGRIALSSGEDEIGEAIVIILSTPIGYRIMRPQFGSRLHELVFAPINTSTMTTAEHYVAEALGYWEPRIDVLQVRAERYPHTQGVLLITIHYRLRATYDERTLVYPFYTIPEEA